MYRKIQIVQCLPKSAKKRIPSDPGGLAIKTDDEDDQFFHRFCWDQLRKHDQELIPRVRLKTPYRTPPLLTISRMLKELENESKKKKMDSPSRNRARSTSDLKSRQYIPNENAPTVKRYNRVSQGNRSRSRYEIYNSTTMPFGKRYREMVTSNIHDIEDNNESSTDSSQSTYATCCSEVETLKMSGFHCIDENTKKHEVTLQASTDETVTEARNYDVSTEEKNKLIENDELKSTAMVKSINERRLMYNMPKSSNWNTYQEEQLTYEPEDQQVHKEVVVRSRSLFSLLEDQPVENLNQNNTQKLVKATSENYLYKEDNQKPRVVDTTPSKRYNSTINLKISNIKSKSQGIKYKSQSDLCRSVEESKRLNRPKSMDYLTHKENKSHTETLKKHFYYHPLKPIKKLNDNELPDPDKVQSTRQLFQKVLKIPLPPSLNNQNPKIGPRPTQEVRVVPDSHKPSIQKCVSVDMGTNIHNKWTDSGSVSSGVGSEASFETESSENNARGDKYSSDDEEYLADKTTIELVGRPVSAEILNKIRKFGTSVTYYGGKVISSSRGEVCSPMTMTIMDEIRHQKEENIKLRLVKSNSCGSRIELMEEIKHSEKQVEAIREEEEDEDLRREKSNQDILDNSSSKSVSSDELSWKALIVIRKKMNNVPVFDMEFEEFEVLDDNNKNRD
ncbi:uncharacterized protein LOC126906041 isoform X2 [Daktulosphaira vitifoliae]|uniref:uncharacterized protein LOC126906041 isoform X2 n=1 Tax=Daktulosphaira vitifoliae TaxID=58002 RepID=UPI0021AA2665|nr:uncharacterized protein LOC126906041 isoform X2 [Daktulosphaira vitifoliae]